MAFGVVETTDGPVSAAIVIIMIVIVIIVMIVMIVMIVIMSHCHIVTLSVRIGMNETLGM